MIVANRKPLDEILRMIKPYKKVLLLGCNECVTVCAVGGEREVGVLGSELRLFRAKEGEEIEVREHTLERQCDPEYIDQVRPFVGDYEPIRQGRKGEDSRCQSTNIVVTNVEPFQSFWWGSVRKAKP